MRKAATVLLVALILFSFIQGVLNENAVKGVSSPIWQMFHYNVQHTGRCPYDTSKNSGTLKWTYQTGKEVWSSPAIASDGTIYVGSEDHYLDAINPDGTHKWIYKTGDRIDSSPAIAGDGTIYIGSCDHYLYAFNPDGTLKWRYKTDDWVWSSPAIAEDGTIYVGSDDHYLYAFNSNGTLKWRYKTGDWISSSPAIASDGTVYVGSGDSYIYAISRDGALKWRYKTSGFVRSSPAIAGDGTIYVGSLDQYLYAVNSNGTLKWRYKTGDGVDSSPAITGDGTIYVGSADQYLYAVKSNGTLKWRYKTGDEFFYSSPVIASDGTIYVGSLDHYLYAINPSGLLKWRYKTGDGVVSSPAIASDGTIYVGSSDHYLYAIGDFIITASAGSGGTISPSGNVHVTCGTRQTFAITPNTGYHIKDVLVDGSSIGAVSSYTFVNVDAPHTISAVFMINLPVITLTSPNGGEEWHPGEIHNITWWTTATPGNSVSISYSVDSGVNWTLIGCAANTGSYFWHIPTGIDTIHARVKVSKVSGCSGSTVLYGSDMSDNDFTIKQVITLVSPNGGEAWHPGETHNITWETATPGNSVSISYSVDSGVNWTLIGCAANTGSYAVHIPTGIDTIHARIKASKVSGCSGSTVLYGSDMSDNDFTIRQIGTAPLAPSNLTLAATSCNKIDLTWKDNSNNETEFRIERKESAGSYSQIATATQNVTSYSDTTVSPEKKYYYRVRAYNSFGNSSYTNEAFATTPVCGTAPLKPTNLTVTTTSTSVINLSWSDVSNNEDGFKLEREVEGGTYTEVKTLSANTTSYSDTGLTPDTTYYYRVRAYNGYGTSDYSNEANAKTLKAAVQIIIRLYIDKTTYYVNDELKEMDVAPIIRESRTMLPIRYIAEALGATIQWDAVERKVMITLKETTIELWIDKNTAKVNGEYKLIDSTNPNVVPIIIPPGRTMLPIRFVAENLGCDVQWDPALNEVKVTYPAS